jgi:hypothetical protein
VDCLGVGRVKVVLMKFVRADADDVVGERRCSHEDGSRDGWSGGTACSVLILNNLSDAIQKDQGIVGPDLKEVGRPRVQQKAQFFGPGTPVEQLVLQFLGPGAQIFATKATNAFGPGAWFRPVPSVFCSVSVRSATLTARVGRTAGRFSGPCR